MASFGGVRAYRKVSVGTGATQEVQVISKPCTAYGLIGSNPGTAGYIRLYDSAVAVGFPAAVSPVVTIAVPASGSSAGFVNTIWARGINFTNGIAWQYSGGVADNDNTVVTTGGDLMTLFYNS